MRDASFNDRDCRGSGTGQHLNLLKYFDDYPDDVLAAIRRITQMPGALEQTEDRSCVP